MRKLLAAIIAGTFAFAVTSSVIAQDQKKEQKKAQVDKGTPAQGTAQKKDQTKAKAKTEAKKKDASKAKSDTKKKPEEKK